MPISNKASQNRMTKTTIRINSNEALRKQQAQNTKRTTVTSNNNNDYRYVRICSYRNTKNFMFYLEYISNC
jgi:hypothetical protein